MHETIAGLKPKSLDTTEFNSPYSTSWLIILYFSSIVKFRHFETIENKLFDRHLSHTSRSYIIRNNKITGIKR